MKKALIVAGILWLLISVYAFTNRIPHEEEWTDETPLSHVLHDLGDKMPEHFSELFTREEAERGRQIIVEGTTTAPDGSTSTRISKYFLCTNCHNTQIEDPDIRVSNPETRLSYAASKNLSFLPATTFYGIVNRVSYYNDDYAKKYGALVAPARDTLVNAMQLCATECSQGRRMLDWEVKSVMAYFYSIEYKLRDLNLTPADWAILKSAAASHASDDNTKAIDMLKSKYLKASPATFTNPYNKNERKYGEGGNSANGEKIYRLGCQSCHKTAGGVTQFKMDDEKITFRFLRRYLKKNNHFSVYYMVRKGTYAVPGYKPYMPNFSLERLSKNQLEDLVAYINEKAK